MFLQSAMRSALFLRNIGLSLLLLSVLAACGDITVAPTTEQLITVSAFTSNAAVVPTTTPGLTTVSATTTTFADTIVIKSPPVVSTLTLPNFATEITNVNTQSWEVLATKIKSSVHGFEPVLLPTMIPAGLQATLTKPYSGVDYSDRTSNKNIQLEVAIPNPPLPSDTTEQRNINFRGVKAFYQILNRTDPTSRRQLIWNEPGKYDYNNSIQKSVPYYLVSNGLTETEFWAVANSLKAIPLDSAYLVADTPSTTTTYKGFVTQLNTSDNTFEVQADRLYKVQLSKATQFLTQDGKQSNFSNLANDFLVIVEGKIDLGQTATSTPIRFIAEKITIIGKLEK